MTKQVPIVENEWISIPAGEFIMGSPDEEVEHEEDEEQHEVSMDSFSMMKHTVTFTQYDAYCETNKVEKPDAAGWGRSNRPVIFVNWHQALRFAAWMTQMTGVKHRLPTEAEWEYACRAGANTPFSFGEAVSTDDANYDGLHAYDEGETGESRKKTVEVGQFKPNPWGLYDMHGNVWEWTASVYDAEYSGGEQRCAGERDFGPRVVRGGSWFHYVQNIRSAYRGRGFPETSLDSFGFRLVRDN